MFTNVNDTKILTKIVIAFYMFAIDKFINRLDSGVLISLRN